MRKINVITIDGPSASGKGSLARNIALKFNLSILDSGSLYRLYAFFLDEGVEIVSIAKMIQKNIDFKFSKML